MTIYNEQNNFACDGEYSNGHETVHFTHGLLNNSVDSDGVTKPAYQNDKGDAEYFENGLLHREAAPPPSSATGEHGKNGGTTANWS